MFLILRSGERAQRHDLASVGLRILEDVLERCGTDAATRRPPYPCRHRTFMVRNDVLHHIIGGIVAGFGGVLGLGGAIGQGIAEMSTLAPGSLPTLVSTVFGSACRRGESDPCNSALETQRSSPHKIA